MQNTDKKIFFFPCFADGKALGPPVLPLAFPKLSQDAVLLNIPVWFIPCLFFPIISQQCFLADGNVSNKKPGACSGGFPAKRDLVRCFFHL